MFTVLSMAVNLPDSMLQFGHYGLRVQGCGAELQPLTVTGKLPSPIMPKGSVTLQHSQM